MIEGWIQALVRRQDPSGCWSDFGTAAGASDAWVTGYAGFALARAGAVGPADRACDWLLAHPGRSGGWGYRSSVRDDADSTAWAVRLLAARGRPVPAAALDFLAAHAGPAGYRTYLSPERSGDWASPAPCVSAAVVLALRESGRPVEPVAPAGPSPWWSDPAYAALLLTEAGTPLSGSLGTCSIPECTGARPAELHSQMEQVGAGSSCSITDSSSNAPDLLSETEQVGHGSSCSIPDSRSGCSEHVMAGQRIGCTHGWSRSQGARTAFGSALRAHLAALDGDLVTARELLAGIPAEPRGDAELLVPAARPGLRAESTVDGRGVFTIATALRAACALPGPTRSKAGRAYDRLTATLAGQAGVSAVQAVDVFRALTAESLAAGHPWPCEQLSSLAGGLPVELSVGRGPALRYAAEVGDPVLPPYARAVSGLAAIGRAARLLGYDEAWNRAKPAADALVHDRIPARADARFWVWGGADAAPGKPAVLKAYLGVLDTEVEGGATRLYAALRGLGVPDDAPIHPLLTLLAKHGWCHELGVGLGPGGRLGAKVYYDLHGWQPDLVAAVLQAAGLSTHPDEVAPEIPGVLRASYARKRRAGIALRVGLPDGRVDEVTIAAAFPPPMVGREKIAERTDAWLGSPEHKELCARLLPRWEGDGTMHSLFTRTATRQGVKDTVYVRPAWPED